MTDEISNKTLAMLLVAAIVVSLGGTLVSLNRLGEVGVSGYATQQSGLANLTIESEVGIYLDDALIFFGSGALNGSLADSDQAILESNSTNSYPNGTWDWTTADNFGLRNTGNVEANVTVTAEDPSVWIGTNAAAWIAVTNGETGKSNACTTDLGDDWQTLGTSSVVVCGELENTEANNFINLSVRVKVPRGVVNDEKANSVVFNAAESSTAG